MRSKRSLKLTLSSICWYCALGSRRYRLQRRSGGCLEFRCQAVYQDGRRAAADLQRSHERSFSESVVELLFFKQSMQSMNVEPAPEE